MLPRAFVTADIPFDLCLMVAFGLVAVAAAFAIGVVVFW